MASPTQRALLLVAALASAAPACKRSRSTAESPPPVPIPASVPAGLQVDAYVGPAACQECHEEVYARWVRSPHGRAMTRPSSDTVLAAFDGAPVAVPHGKVTPFVRDGDYWMRLDSDAGAATEEHKVDLVLGAGRQHQTFITRLPDGSHRLLPLFWTTLEGKWIATNLYTFGSLDPKAHDYWYVADMLGIACTTCHLSQAHFALDNGLYVTRWVDLSVSCEACHGPGREHVAKRRAGEVDATYRDLHAIDKREDAELCGQCHGRHESLHLTGDEPWRQPRVFVTLDSTELRVDGTQQLPAYQIAGHLLSRCYQDGAMTCASCHEPHDQTARSLVGENAEGEGSNLQCTVCHRDRRDAAAARQHSRHGDGVTCVDCHMAPSWMGDTPERQQRTADHSIQIPRPLETIEFGTPNACTTCHDDLTPQTALAALREWGATRATGKRAWVEAIDAGRKRAPGAAARLLAVIEAPDTGDFLRQSALDLLQHQPPDRTVVDRIAPLATDPSPHTRGAAIAALMTHAADPEKWRRLGAADAHPYVRQRAFLDSKDPSALSEQDIATAERDIVAYQILPFASLGILADAHVIRGDRDRALRIIENAGAHLNNVQRVVLGLAGRRARLLAPQSERR